MVDLSTAIRLDPSESLPYLNRGGVWLEKHDVDRAIKDLNKAIALDPQCDGAHLFAHERACSSISSIKP